MDNKLGENAHLDIAISNLHASEDELGKLRSLVAKNLGSNAINFSIQSVAITAKGAQYEVKFTVINPKHFNLDRLRDWLHEALLVGWHLNATFVNP